jgi:hypothetical protein
LVSAIGLSQQRDNFFFVQVLISKPSFAALLVVEAGNSPMVVNLQILLEVKKQVVRRHHPAREKKAGHPVV